MIHDGDVDERLGQCLVAVSGVAGAVGKVSAFAVVVDSWSMLADGVGGRPAAAFGAGNIASTSKAEGQRFRHGDIEDVLLTLAIRSSGKKFSKMDVKRVYFGNWLRESFI